MSNSDEEFFDIAVIGAGPAGATVAAFLAQRGRKVIVLEKAEHPRFHIGESLLPKNLPILERLGVLDQVQKIGIHKPGAEVISPDHEHRQSYLFSQALDPDPTYAYQVHRAQFDEILVRNACSKGADVREGCTVTDLEFGTTEQRVIYAKGDAKSACRARFVIDATGRDGLLARRLELRRQNKAHNSAAIFAHFDGVSATAWETPGTIGLFWFDHGWFWMIPLTGNTTSIGAVCMPDYLKSRRGTLEEFFFQTISLCPKLSVILEGAKPASPVRAAGNYSYKAERAFGPGFLLLGDAYAFVDPVFSSGVFLAMSSAEGAADTVDQALDHPERAKRLFTALQRRTDRGIKRFSWFIYRFNTPALRSLFMRPRNSIGMRKAVISMLAGDVYRNGGIGWQLVMFRFLYGLAWLIKFRRSRKLDERRSSFASISTPEDEGPADLELRSDDATPPSNPKSVGSENQPTETAG
jgi:flavin-dependent dehydrogenase